MKKLSAFVFAVAICVLGNAQDFDTHVKDGRIVYQHVFEGVIENPLKTIENWPGVDNVRDLNGAFFGDLTFRGADVIRVSPELGLTWGNTMIFLRAADTSRAGNHRCGKRRRLTPRRPARNAPNAQCAPPRQSPRGSSG